MADFSSATENPAVSASSSHTDLYSAAAAPKPARRTRSSRFSVLLEGSVDYAAYRAAYGRQFLQQQPRFDSLRDAEHELKCVLHDDAFSQAAVDGAVMAENVALAVDWFISALVQLFDGDEPFQNPDFLRLGCMFFASPLYENNTRLVQRHLVKRTYAELSVGPSDTGYERTAWLLLAMLHLITEFQPDTYLLCKDSGLFPLLQRLVLGCTEKHLHVLAMSLMFEIAQSVTLSQTDAGCVTDELLLFLLDYIERMRYAESDVYNNTGTKLVLALNEQFLRIDGYTTMPQSPAAGTQTQKQFLQQQHLALVERLGGAIPAAPLDAMQSPVLRASLHTRTASASQSPPPVSALPGRGAGLDHNAPAAQHAVGEAPCHPALRTLTLETHSIPRSRSMDFRNQGEESAVGSSPHDAVQPVSTPVVAILTSRVDCCKTFTENLVFLLNRETDPATQVLILHMLNCILSDPGTAGIIYTNDMHVLIDILLRDLSNLSEGMQQLRQAYLLVVCALLRNPGYLAARHRLSDIELCLVSMLRQSLVCLQVSVGSAAGSRRGSVSSSSSTRHNSMASDVLVVPTVDIRRTAGAASPASSLSSAVSDETCCPRSVDNSPSLGAVTKTSRRPAPPVPPPSSRSKLGQKPPCNPLGSLTTPAHRRRPAPPPPPPMALSRRQNSPLPATSAFETHGSSSPRSHRRRAPPPPPCARTAPTPTPLLPSQPALASGARQARGKQTEQTGIRRQLSVKKSVSRYKRDSIRVAPLPPPRSRNSSVSSKTPISPVIEVSVQADDDDDDEEEDSDTMSLPSGLDDSSEARRITRKLVEGAIRCCHEARMTASATHTPRR
ncbi:pre-rRNA processing [Coemansia sp. RSA 485]|nr:pre-rRNA processing [Coemansia sp. RSA 485]